MNEMFKKAIDDGASDIHFKSSDFVRARLNGELIPLTEQKISHAQVRELALKLIPHEKDRAAIDELTDFDCSWGLPGLGRFRVNIMRQRGVLSIIMRIIPIEIPSFADLKLPPVLERISNTERGLILVTGPTGSGKTTTLYAALNELNRPDTKIITAENPVEYNLAGINQAEVKEAIGYTFGRILRAMLRQSPNVILVGEIRDPETAEIAVQAALTGH